MENFGLGLILSFQDNASSGMDKVMGMLEKLRSSIEEMSNSTIGSIDHLGAMTTTLGVLGAAATGVGLAITTAFGGIIQKTMQMSSGFEQNITALTQLYGSADKAREKFLAFEQMSAATPLGMQSIQSAATRLKTVGIEAEKTFNVMVDGQKKMRPVLEILGDLAAIRPDKGLETVIREGIEFIEGNYRPLKMSFGLDVRSKDSLGEALAGTAEERLDQLVRMIEKAGYTGMLDKTNDQWSTIMQNLGDNFDLLMYYVGIGSGFFDEIKTPFKELFLLLRDIVGEQDDMKIIGGAIADGLRLVVAPALLVMSLLNKLVAGVAQFTKDHPKIVSMGLAIVGLGGQLLTVAGILVTFTALWIKFNMATRITTVYLPLVSKALGLLRVQLFAVTRTMLPLIAASATLYLAWKTNMFGIRTITQNTIGYLSNLFEILSDALTHVDVEKGVFSLSKKHKNMAEEMGIMPLVNALVVGYHYAVMFGKGLEEGFNTAKEVIESTGKAVDDFLASFEGTPLQGFAEDLKEIKSEFTTMFNPQTANDVEYLGKVLGEFATYGVILYGLFSIGSMLVTVFTTLFGVVSTIVGWVGTAFGVISSVVSALVTALGFLGGVISAIALAFGVVLTAPPLLIGAIAVAIVALVGLIYAYWEEITSFLSDVWDSIAEGISSVYDSVSAFFSDLWNSISTSLSEGYNVVASFFSELWGGISEAISPIIDTLSYIIDYVSTVADLIYQRMRLAFYSVLEVVMDFVNEAVSFIGGFVDKAKQRLTPIVSYIGDLFTRAATIVWNSFINPVINFYTSLFEVVVRIFNDIVTAITGFVSDFISLVLMGVNAVISFFIWCYQQVMETFINPIISAFQSIYDMGVLIFGQVESLIISVFEKIGSFASEVFGKIKGLIKSVLEGIGSIMDKLPSLPSLSELKEKAGLVEQAANEKADKVGNKNALGGIYDNPIVTWVAEAGYPEAIIPLDGSSRGMALWEEAGRRLGALPSSVGSISSSLNNLPVPTVSAPNSAPAGGNTNSGGITFEAGSIQFTVTTDNFDAEKAAKMIMPIIQRQAEIMKMTHRAGGAFA